ncbi:hypothetical protein ACAW74_15470 [Fibrella sp. WM1]|uniref:hypothetical protein n=1 Tax=Fibrella musci TaxID=3242485 RepID=UPI0035204F7F
MRYILLLFPLLVSLRVCGQNTHVINHTLSYTQLQGATPLVVPLPITAAEFAQAKANKNQFQLRLTVDDAPSSANQSLALATIRHQEPASVNLVNGTIQLDYVLNLQPDNKTEFVPTKSQLIRAVTWSDTTLRPLHLLLPDIQPGFTSQEDNAIQIDFCAEDNQGVRFPFARKWPFIKADETIRAVVRHVNPLRYNAALGADGIAFNTDPGAAFSAVSGIFDQSGIFFKKNDLSSSISISAPVRKLEKLTGIAPVISQRLSVTKRLDCLSEADLALLRSLKVEQQRVLDDYKIADEFALKATLTQTANAALASLTAVSMTNSTSISSTTSAVNSSTITPATGLTTTVRSVTTSQNNSLVTDAGQADEYTLYVRALAEYALTADLASRTFKLIQTLDDVVEGSTLRLRPFSPKQYTGADVIRVTLSTAPAGNTAVSPTKQSYDLWVTGRLKIDYSAGVFFSGLADESFSTRDTTFKPTSSTATVTRQIKDVDDANKLTVALGVLAHAYWRLPILDGTVTPGLTAGSGITFRGRPIVVAGASLLLGRAQRVVFTYGWSFGIQRELSARYEKLNNYATSDSTPFTYVDTFRGRWFFGLTFNWGKNEKIVTTN